VEVGVDLAKEALRRAARALKPSEVDRLIRLIIAERPELAAEVDLAALQDDEDFRTVLTSLFVRGDVNAADVAGALEAHLHGRNGKALAEAVLERVWRVADDDRTALVVELQRSGTARPVLLSLEWVPAPARNALRRLSEVDEGGFVDLDAELRDKDDKPEALLRLVSARPRWVRDGSWELWTTIGHLFAAYGRWTPSEEAFLEASDRPGADRPMLLAKAAEAALAAGRLDRYSELVGLAQAEQPDHPDVKLVLARRNDDPEEILALLEGVQPERAAQLAAVEATRSMALMALDRLDEAYSAWARAREVDPQHPMVRELEPTLTLVEQTGRLKARQEIDVAALRRAVDQFLALKYELDELGRTSEGARFLARAAEAALLGGESVRALRLLKTALSGANDSLESGARAHLARVALELEQPELALELVSATGDDEESQLIWAIAVVQSNSDDLKGALSSLKAFVQSGSPRTAEQAAFALLTGATENVDVPWDAEAESFLASIHPELLPILRAQFLVRRERVNEARNVLLQNAHNPDALQLLAGLAAEEGDWKRAIDLTRTLVERLPTPDRQLLLAEVMLRGGEVGEAGQLLARLRDDITVSDEVRRRAYALSAADAWKAEDFPQVEEIARRWLELAPEDPQAQWGRIQALARLGRFSEAHQLLASSSVEPRGPQDANVAAVIYSESLEPFDAATRIKELLDAFPEDEHLNAQFIVAGLNVPEESRHEPISDSVRNALATFPDRFPKSKLIRAVKAPESPEEVPAFFKAHFAAGAEESRRRQTEVVRGDAPVAALAATIGRSVCALWSRLEILPLTYSDSNLLDWEREVAWSAIPGGAVIDTAALSVLARLRNTPVPLAVRGALPALTVPRAVVEDALAARPALPGRDDEESIEAGWDPVAQVPRIYHLPREARERFRELVEFVITTVQELNHSPDVDSRRPDEFDEFLSTIEDRAFRTWPATLSVAKRLDLAVYSDDRYVRRTAREAGLRTFGTLALLDVLAEKNLLLADDVLAARSLLRSEGAVVLPSAPDELVDEVRAVAWDMPTTVRAALTDDAVWATLSEGFAHFLPILSAVSMEAPERTREWLAYFREAAALARPKDSAEYQSATLLGVALEQGDEGLFKVLLEAWGVSAQSEQLVNAFKLAVAPIGKVRSEDQVRRVDRLLTKIDFTERERFLHELAVLRPGLAAEFVRRPHVAITPDEVRRVATLARLALTNEEVERFGKQLSAILVAVSRVSELDLSDVPPTSHPLEIANAWEEDEPRPCLTLDEAFANAPDRDDDYFRSPPA
jgi:aspartyl-tRNA(Asn)/glutamyl-tRNA(Gln) amidotransferase subunit C